MLSLVLKPLAIIFGIYALVHMGIIARSEPDIVPKQAAGEQTEENKKTALEDESFTNRVAEKNKVVKPEPYTLKAAQGEGGKAADDDASSPLGNLENKLKTPPKETND